ncbi:MAG: hypothetical protein JWM37_582 [Candidatus Saccharibacteria bacterium]|nr:hypothetical protein [Candidatus Saccharibacteria bacterium]
MRYYSEIYLLETNIKNEHWQKLYRAMLLFCGWGTSFDFIFTCHDNQVRFFVVSPKDISSLSNAVDGILLRPVTEDAVKCPETTRKARMLQFVTGGNILDFKEKLAVKYSLQLEMAVVSVKPYTDSKALVKNVLYMKDAAGQWATSVKRHTFFPAHLFAIDFSSNTHYLKTTVPKYLNIEKSLHMLNSANVDALFEVDTFPYFSHNYYLNLPNYEFDLHSFIIGASGSGKSKLISLFVDRLYQTALRLNYRVVVIDPHASLEEDFLGMPDSKIIRFNDESTELFASAGADVSAATELTATLFKSLLADQYTPRLDRLLRFSLFVLFTAQNMSLDTLKRFLTDIELRNQVLDHVREFVPPNITKFFGGDFNEMRTQYYNETISPIVSLVDEMQLQPALVGNGDVSLAKTINENFLTVFSLNKVKMGQKVVKTVAGLIIQQIFLLAQSRAFNQKVIMIIDEVSVVQTPALASILAEARKYNLYVFLTQQYFGQIEDDLKAAIFANVYNYYVFRTSEEDARALEGNLKIELPAELVAQESARGVKEIDLRIRMLTELHPRECIARLLSKGQLNPCVKLRTMDAPQRVAQPGNQITDLQAYEQIAQTINLPSKFVETPSPSHTGADQQSSPAPAPAAQMVYTEAPPPMSMNLSELMAQHSSGRKEVHPRKETA